MKGQKRSSDILTKQSKASLAKSSTKLFFVSRLRGKKYKTSGSSKVLQDASNTLDTSQGAAQVPQKVPQIHASFLVSRILSSSHRRCFCVVRQRLSPDALGDEGFFDLLSRFQSNRMDDQRCSVQKKGSRLSLNTGQESPQRVIRKCKRARTRSPWKPKALTLDRRCFSLCSRVRVCKRVGRPRPAGGGDVCSRREPARPQAPSEQQPGGAQPPDGQRRQRRARRRLLRHARQVPGNRKTVSFSKGHDVN